MKDGYVSDFNQNTDKKKTETFHSEHKRTPKSQMVLWRRVCVETYVVWQKLGECVMHPSVHERLLELVV